MAEPFKYLADVGVAAVLAILVMLAYQRVVDQLGNVITNNTQAITKLNDITASNCVLLTSHDKRADDMQAALARIEGNVLQVLELVKRERERLAS